MTPVRPRRPRRLAAALLLLVASPVVGACGSRGSAVPAAGATSAGTTSSTHGPGMVMADGSTMGVEQPAAESTPGPTAPDGTTPSLTARMVCQGQVEGDVTELLGVTPTKAATFDDHLFTCTYTVPEGKLRLLVHESDSVSAAQAYFAQLRAAAASPVTLEGFESLGLPAFKSPAGTAAFVRDDKTLLVDATGLPALVGPQDTARMSFAYTVATDVLDCWKHHAPTG